MARYVREETKAQTGHQWAHENSPGPSSIWEDSIERAQSCGFRGECWGCALGQALDPVKMC